MSIFEGVLKELPNVSIDRFNGDNLKSSCYFLSHCHSDHMHGLKDVAFALHLSKHKDYYIYCSPITALILNSSELDIDESHIKEISDTTVIKVPENELVPVSYEVTVTTIPAGHCPGSVMFLFETAHETFLYTGDFRYAKGDIEKFLSLRNMNWVKKIDKLYFDATFLNEKYWNFPTRHECLDEIINLVTHWLNKNSKNVVHLETSAKYGCEFLFIKLFREFKCKIHVDESIYNLYWNVPDIGHVLTTGDNETKIYVHARLNDFNCADENVLHIKASAQWYKWRKDKPKPAISWTYVTRGKTYSQVCFSTHSSCSELLDFLNYLKPRSLHACTSVVGLSEEKKKDYICKLQQTWVEDETEKSESESNNVKELERIYPHSSPLKIRVPKNNRQVDKNLLDSPPMRKQRLSRNRPIS